MYLLVFLVVVVVVVAFSMEFFFLCGVCCRIFGWGFIKVINTLFYLVTGGSAGRTDVREYTLDLEVLDSELVVKGNVWSGTTDL